MPIYLNKVKGAKMTEAFTKPIILTKEMGDNLVKALSDENRKRVEHFNKYERPKLKRPADYKPKLSVEEIMKAYE